MKNKLLATRLWSKVMPLFFLLIMYCFSVSAQQNIHVHGVVASKSGTPLIGVSVSVEGSQNGTVSDSKGEYKIQAEENDTLVFSYVGYAKQYKAVTQERIDVVLKLSSNKLNDLVVIGYGKKKKADVTGAVSTISGKELVRTPSVTTSSALVGKVQGITTRATDARPGNGTRIQIRSLGDPLFVIDGVPYGGNTGTDGFGLTSMSGQDVFNNLNMNDIESITILKDASAAIYGLRASNGVVLITTKKGSKNQKPRINLSGYYGIQNFTRYPKPANAYQFIRAQVESAENLGQPAPYSKQELAKWKTGKGAYKSYNYFDQVMAANVPQYNVDASVTGGTEKSTYYLGASHIKQKGVVKDFYFQRSNIQANVSTDLSEGLNVGAQISANIQKRHNVGLPGLDDYFNPFLSILSMWPTESPYANGNPKYIHQTHNVNVNPATYDEDITGWINDLRRELNVNLNAEYDFDFGLKIKGIYSRTFQNEDFDGFEYTYKAYKYDESTDTYYTQPGYGNPNPWREKHKRNVRSRYAQLRASYEKQLDNHFISAMVGYELSDYRNSYIAIHGVPTNNYIQQMQFSNLDYLGDIYDVEAREGYVGRISYNYKGKYLVEFLGRYDGSYLYDPDKRWGFFPGVTAGWRISSEPFFKNFIGDVVNNLKIRFSYGVTGSELGVSPFGYISGYNFNAGGAYLDGSYVIGLQNRGLPVRNLSWVRNKTTDIGLDIALLDSKITGTFDVYQRKRTGLPAARYDVLLPSEVGYILPPENLNSDATLGVEGKINYNGHSGDFDYSIGVNATLARWKYLHSYKPRFGNSWDEYRNSKEERWDFIDWGYQVVGRFQNQEQIDNY
ncbi:MAG TPA: SusC/RagA family TonB-linked outer membrane protein, partial [Chitinophagaceae bacterium]|nr:SusC/RagA family TonB-linked outer membrane protein [Chitinophagaceae bacterium]